MNKFIQIICLTFLTLVNVLAQKNQIDDLKSKLQNAEPKEKVSLYLKLSGLAENYEEKVSYCERAINLANELKDVELQANANFTSGIYHYSEGKYSEANKTFTDALGFYNKRNDLKSVAKTYYWLAMSNRYWGKYKTASEYAKLGLNLNESLKSKEGIIESNLVLGSIHQAWGFPGQANSYFDVALKGLENKNESVELGFALLGKGNVMLDLGKTDSAKLLFDKSHKVFTKLQNKFGEASALRDLAKYYLIKKDSKKAETSIDQSIKILKSLNNRKGLADVYVLKGNMYLKKGNFARAVELYMAGQKIAVALNLNEEVAKNYKIISKAYESRKDYTKALKYFKLYSAANDSLLTYNTNEQLSDLQDKYETEKKDKEELMQKTTKKVKQSSTKNTSIIVLLAVFGIAASVIAVVLFKKFGEKEKENIQTIEQQKEAIEISKNQLSSSIDYATRVQGALLSDITVLNSASQGSFVFYKPKDIVGGDFYWFKQIGKKLVIVVGDGTGNGVSGAFMSIMGISFLEDLIGNKNLCDTAQILEELRKSVKSLLLKEVTDDTTKDGLEMAICIFDTETLQMQFSGANLPLYLIRGGNLEIYKGTNNPIGFYLREKPFESQHIQLMHDDNIYMFTNGYMDQFGGKNGGKFKITHFRDALLAICETDMVTQKDILNKIFVEWKNSKYEQTDDVLVLGMKV